MNDRNIGRFKISTQLVQQEPEKVAEILALLKVVPVKAEMLFVGNCIEYTALSCHFESIPTGAVIPDYNIIVETDSGGRPEIVSARRFAEI